MSKNPIIVFEGIEASGKSTNIKIVAKYLKKRKKKFIKLREPGGSKISESIRKIILNKKSQTNNKTDLLLMLAARSENIEKIIKKNYKKKIILIDRFTDSTLAYQHYGMGLDLSLIKKINFYITENIKPNYTFLSIVKKNAMKKRLKYRRNKNRYDKFNFSFYKKVQSGFKKISKNKKNYFIIDTSKNSINDVTIKINAYLDKII